MQAPASIADMTLTTCLETSILSEMLIHMCQKPRESCERPGFYTEPVHKQPKTSTKVWSLTWNGFLRT